MPFCCLYFRNALIEVPKATKLPVPSDDRVGNGHSVWRGVPALSTHILSVDTRRVDVPSLDFFGFCPSGLRDRA